MCVCVCVCVCVYVCVCVCVCVSVAISFLLFCLGPPIKKSINFHKISYFLIIFLIFNIEICRISLYSNCSYVICHKNRNK